MAYLVFRLIDRETEMSKRHPEKFHKNGALDLICVLPNDHEAAGWGDFGVLKVMNIPIPARRRIISSVDDTVANSYDPETNTLEYDTLMPRRYRLRLAALKQRFPDLALKLHRLFTYGEVVPHQNVPMIQWTQFRDLLYDKWEDRPATVEEIEAED